MLAVGASSDFFDYRSHYSQYGSSLDFVASSGGGYGAIMTTDRTGTAGYNASGDYYTNFRELQLPRRWPPKHRRIGPFEGRQSHFGANVASRLNENCQRR